MYSSCKFIIINKYLFNLIIFSVFFRNINPNVSLELIHITSKGGHGATTYAFALISLYLGGNNNKGVNKTAQNKEK